MGPRQSSSRLIGGLAFFVTLVSLLGWAATGWAAIELAPALRMAPIEPGGGTSGEAAGPVFFYTRRPSRLEWGVRPLFSSLRNEELASDEFDLLYPVLTRRSRPDGTDVQLLQVIRWSTTLVGGGPSTDWMVFPLLAYQGKRPDRDEGFAFFPLYGSLHQFLGQTHLRFTLFPLWLSLERNQIARHYILWPFFGWAAATSETAPRAHGWRFWPFYGELIQEGVMEERFALWPIYSHLRFGLNSDAPIEELAVLPFYTMRHSPEEQSTTWLWPLFSHIVRPASHYSEWDLPWPLIRFGSGDDKSIRHVFPFYRDEWRIKTVSLFNKSERVRSTSRLFLWPLYHATSDTGPDWYHNRTEVLLLLYSDVRTKQSNTPEGHRIALWPLFTYNKTPDGAVTFQTLAPIEPFLSTEPITRNYSPLWSLATYRREGATSEFSLMWGLFHWTATEREHRLRFFFLPSIHWTRNAPLHSGTTPDLPASPDSMNPPNSPNSIAPPDPPTPIDPAGPVEQTP